MRLLRRLIIWVLLICVLAWGGVKLFLRAPRGEAWLQTRLSAELGLAVSLDGADLGFPDALRIVGLTLSAPDAEPGAPALLRVDEARLMWRFGRRRLSLRRPELLLQCAEAHWTPLRLAPLERVDTAFQPALEQVSRRFRDRWDWQIRDGRISALDATGNPSTLARGLNWSIRRVPLPDRTTWHQEAERLVGKTDATTPERTTWLSLDSGAIVLLPPRAPSGLPEPSLPLVEPDTPPSGETDRPESPPPEPEPDPVKAETASEPVPSEATPSGTAQPETPQPGAEEAAPE